MNVLLDLRQATRSLARSPAFTVTASVTLAVGLGAAIAALSVSDKLLRQPLGGIRDQDRMIVIRSSPPPTGTNFAINNWVSPDDFADRFRSAGQVAGYLNTDISVGFPGKRSRLARSTVVSGNYFDLLGVAPVLGSFAPPPEAAGGAVLSDQLWAALFDRRVDAVGATITVEGSPVTIIGIAPPAFRGTERLSSTDIWFPRTRGGNSSYQFVGRLEPGVSVGQAESLIKTIISPKAQVFAGLGPPTTQRAQVAQFLQLSVAGSLLVLLIACANVANLLLFRGLARRAETGVHRALGASTSSVIRRQLTEAMVLAVPAMVVGIPFSILLTRMLGKVRLTRLAEPFGPVPIDWSQIALAVLGAVLVAGAAGVLPAIVAARTAPLQGVQDMGRSRGATRLRQVFATTQVALSLSLVVAMSLMVGTMLRLRSIDLGFESNGVLLLTTDPGDAGYQPGDARTYQRNLLARFQAAPEFSTVAVANHAPLAGGQMVLTIRLPDKPAAEEVLRIRVNPVSADYFDVLQMPLLEGRSFTAAEMFPDSLGARKIILGKTVATAVFGDRPALGKTVYMSRPFLSYFPHEVVGVVGDSHWDHVEPKGGWVEDPRLLVYTPYEGPSLMRTGPMAGRSCAGTPACMSTLLVRARGSDEEARAAIRRVAAEADPLLPAYDVTTLNELVDLSIVERNVRERNMTILAMLATGLAAVGVYGLIAYTVASRQRDLGIRIALGARTPAVAGLLLKEVFLVGSVGVVIGLAGGAMLSRLIASHLYGVSPVDTATYAVAALALLGTAVAASVPAIRSATRVDPIVSLKS